MNLCPLAVENRRNFPVICHDPALFPKMCFESEMCLKSEDVEVKLQES